MARPTTTVRLVRCPRCFLILPEPPNVTIYACGGCGTRLQAKVRRNDAGNTASNSDETNAAQTNRSVRVSDGEPQGSPGFHSSGESSLNQNGGSGEITYSNSNAEQNLTASNGDRINVNDHEDFGNDTDQLRGQSNGDIENETDRSGARDLVDEQIANVNLSNEDQSSVSDQGESGDDTNQWRGQSNGNIENETDGSGSGDLGNEQIANESLSNEDQRNVSGHDESGDDTDQLRSQSNGDFENDTNGSGARDLGDEQIANVSVSNKDQSYVSGHGESGDDTNQLRGQSNEDTENETDGSGCGDLGDEQIANESLSNEDQSNVSGHDESGDGTDQLRRQLNGDIENDTNVSGARDLGDEQIANVNLSKEVQSNVSGHGESGDDTNQLRGYSNGEIRNETDGSGSRDLGDEQIANESLSNEGQSNVSGHDESGDDTDQLKGQSNEDIENETDGNGSGDLGDEQIANEILSNEDQNSETDDRGLLEHNAEQPRICGNVYSPTGHTEIFKKQPPLSSEEEERESDNNCSESEEVKAKVDARNEGNTTVEEAHSRQINETNGSASVLTVHLQAQENMLQEFHVLSCDGQLEQHQENVDHRRGFVDTSETTAFVNPSSEFSDNLVDLSKSPTTRSSRAYYDDGVSSNEWTDDQLHDLLRQSFKKAQKPPRYVASGERPRKEKYLLDNDYKMQHQLRNTSPVFSRKRDDAPKTVRFDRDEQLNPEKIDHPNRWRTLEDGSSSRVPFYCRNSLAGYQHHGSSYQLPNGYHWNSNISSHEKLLQTEEENMKLLRMVYELQGQLKTCFLNESADERVSTRVKWNNHQNPMHYGLEALEGENYFYPQHPGRYRERNNWPHQCEYSHRPSSANITDFRQQLDGYRSCSSEEWQSSVQLPQPTLTRGSCSIHSGVNSHNAYNSCPVSPMRSVDPEIPLYIPGTKSCDQGQREYTVHKYNREKQQSVKRHLRPIASAAPFITCSNCLTQLQLPADFLLFNKGCHRLRCGACQKVHKFSLLGRSHLVPHTPGVKTAPPSEVDDCADSVDRRHVASSAHKHHRIPRVGPGSHSDETGEKVSYHDKAKKTESAEPSSSMSKSKKAYSENAELPACGGWPLHQLMGYSSPSQVIYERGGASGVSFSSYFSE